METIEWIIIGGGIVVALPLALLGFMIMRQSFRDFRRTKHILRTGKSASAIVNSIRQTASQINDQPEVYLNLTITTENGETFHKIIKTVIPVVNVPQFQQGRKIRVKYIEQAGEREVAVEGAYLPK